MSTPARRSTVTNIDGGPHFTSRLRVFWLVVCLVCLPASVQAAKGGRPNIIFIMADDKN